MDLGLRGKAALITGSSRGIGRAIAFALAAEGCRVSICSRGKEELERTAAELSATGAEVVATAADLSTAEGIQRVVEATLAAFGRVDVLVNNTGGTIGAIDVLKASDDDWQETLDLNLLSHVRASRLIIPKMQEQRGGVVINISSIWGREWGGPGTYNAVKAAEISLTKHLARRLGRYNIRVNSVAPGAIVFPGGTWDKRFENDPEGREAFIKAELPYGRFGRPEEIANMVVFLASDKASLVSGANIPVDGAQSRSNI